MMSFTRTAMRRMSSMRFHTLASLNMAERNTVSTKIDNEMIFHNELPIILDNLMNSPKLTPLPDVASWMRQVLEYNIKGGKHIRGIMTTLAYDLLEKPENITEEYRRLSRVLGWCLEFLQGFYCVGDDIMDNSTTRRGSPCWYRLPHVGMGAVNDFLLIECSILETLELYFLNTPHFIDVIRLFNKVNLYTSMGQHMDYVLAHHTNKDYAMFNKEYFEKTLIPYKNCFFTIKSPLLSALTLVKDVDMQMYAGMEEVCDMFSKLYQMQDDYIDVYGDEALTGKAGTDIQENKCTWLAVAALQRCNETQRQLFTKHYGSKIPEDVAIIKNIYYELQLKELYKQTEIEMYDNLMRLVHALPSAGLSKYFLILIDKLYKRDR